MADLKKAFYEHLSILDKHFFNNICIGSGISDLLKPFIDSLKGDGALPYLIEGDERFRASPLASSIIWLDHGGLLSTDVLDILQDKLIFLKDKCEDYDNDKGFPTKKDDDINGWSYCEGVSVWSTSLAIIALLDCSGNGLSKAEKFKSAILWLANQHKSGDKGWAYQKWDNCAENAIMTSLAIQALSLSLYPDNIIKFNFAEKDKKTILKSVTLGIEYLTSTLVKKGKYAYWCFENNPSCTATTWSLLALSCARNIPNHDKGIDSFYDTISSKCLNFIIAKIPSKSEKWADEKIVNEGGAKYNKHKNYYCFAPTLLIQLFELGVSPYHPKVISQIKWLLNNKNDWKITEYDVEKECTFTYAMTISVIFKWLTMVGYNSDVLLLDDKSFKDKLTRFVFGFNSKKTSAERIVLKKNIDFCFTLLITIIFIVLLFPYYNMISSWIASFAKKIFLSDVDQHNIYINLISTALFTLITVLFNKFLLIVRRWFIK